ncbi:MAG: DUF2520 domain-containing protein [Bacteroidetes bacterium]|nr:DUF2520 domain-containing protein [Bacteroidota bacterium]
MKDLRCALIGSGNVATHLGIALHRAGVRITCVYSRNGAHARTLAAKVHSKAVTKISGINEADVFLIAVKDDAISAIAKKLNVNDGIVLHTSGSVGIDVLKKFNQHGVLYPLQSLSVNRNIHLEDVPMCIEANDKSTLLSVSNIASVLSDFVYELDSHQRAAAHLAAVFANNFSNHMYHIADSILEEHDLPFDLVRPLILETAMKVLDHSPAASQTGPASRNDKHVISRHLASLKKNPALRKIYFDITKNIAAQKKKRKK